MTFQLQVFDKDDILIRAKLNAFLSECTDFFMLSHGRQPQGDEFDRIEKSVPAGDFSPKKEIIFSCSDSGDIFLFVDLILRYRKEGQCCIGYFIIHPSFQSQGLGRTMFTLLAEKLRQYGLEEILLVVQSRNERAIIFWQKMGFKCLETRPGQLTLDPELVMSLLIS